MNITTIKGQDLPAGNYSTGSSSSTDSQTANENSIIQVEDLFLQTSNVGGDKDAKTADAAKVKNQAQALTKLMQLMNADLQFEVHEETKSLMVKLVDVKTQKVLKEFPPHEFLDMIAKIRHYVGVLLDKQA